MALQVALVEEMSNMNQLTKAQLSLLASAEDSEGNPIHPNLRDTNHYAFCDKGVVKYGDGTRDCGRCDPTAMLDAICRRWSVSVGKGGMVGVQVSHGLKGLLIGNGETLQERKTDAMFQATETLEPANWERCPCSQDFAKIDSELCGPCDAMPVGECNAACTQPCHGTGYIIKVTK